MITIKQGKKLGRSQTIDLKYQNAREYIDKVDLESPKERIIDYIYMFLVIMGAVFLGFIIFLLFTHNTYADDNIRQARLEACKQAKNEYREHIKERYIHINQDWVTRCATYSTLIYAKETGFGKSRMCLEDKNCHGLRRPTYDIRIDYKVGRGNFLIFNNFDDSNLAFARLYARFHMNKTADELIKGVWRNGQRVGAYSQTDQDTYIHFLNTNYWRVYNEIKNM